MLKGVSVYRLMRLSFTTNQVHWFTHQSFSQLLLNLIYFVLESSFCFFNSLILWFVVIYFHSCSFLQDEHTAIMLMYSGISAV